MKIRFTLFWIFIALAAGHIRAQEFQKKFGDNDRVDMVVVTPDMFSLINEVNENPERAAFYKNLTYFGTFGTNDADTGDRLMSFARSFVQHKQMRLLVQVKQPDKVAEFYYTPAGKPGFASEIVLMIRYPQAHRVRVWHIKGMINLRKISLLALQTTKIDTDVLREAEKKVE